VRQQINIALPEETAKRIRHDAVDMGLSLQDWADLAFTKFLGLPVAQRRGVSSTRKRKILGRPIEDRKKDQA
jgi:hypothetical protein